MSDLETRIRVALGDDWDRGRSSWEALMRLYAADREAFYRLACDGRDEVYDDEIRDISRLAREVRGAVRGGYHIRTLFGTKAVVRSDVPSIIVIPAPLIEDVRDFLRAIDGKGAADRPGTDYGGRPISEAEVRFKLGECRERTPAPPGDVPAPTPIPASHTSPAHVAAWVIHRDLAREPMYREDFRDVTLTPDGRVEYVSVPSGRRMEIVVRPVE